MEMLDTLLLWCSPQVRLALLRDDLIPELIDKIDPLSLSFDEAENIHTNLLSCINRSLWLATPDGLEELENEDWTEEVLAHETVLKQVLTPSEEYICHLCENRFSIIDGDQSNHFMEILALLIRISPYYQPEMDFLLNMQVFLAVPSCLTFFENDESIWSFLYSMIDIQREWNKDRGISRSMWKDMQLMLKTEGFEDVIETISSEHIALFFDF
ncbi:hypothetical protein BLNAU_1577 [Blattamonas nauphoetae]|uniref:Uncharacterized protein n=1 Tax=Blattamonas nauphoetae TaxID=2049346 RepID=A0ABQ9YIF0_9EUKA|nr:hypothetical protein BLNAU_1577 [Blattamonas nauphoetae]